MPDRTLAMLRAHPDPTTAFSPGPLAECLDACLECEAVCSSCADACLAEEHVAHLRRCVRLNLDCADICSATGRVLSRLTAPDPAVLRAQLEACRAACRACGDECERHAQDMGMEHCRVCAEACRRCEAACTALIDAPNA